MSRKKKNAKHNNGVMQEMTMDEIIELLRNNTNAPNPYVIENFTTFTPKRAETEMIEEDVEEFDLNKLPKPKDIHAMLNQHVIGQDEAKKTLAVAIYNHYKRIASFDDVITVGDEYKDVTIEKSNILMLGQTGTGKTHIIKTIANFLGVPCYIADATKLTESGYVGDDVESIIVGLLKEADYDIDLTERGIVVIDEIDKLTKQANQSSITRDVGGTGVQQGLLKIVEGCEIGVPPEGGRKHPDQPLIYVDTNNILFIGMGAFVGLEDIINRRLKKQAIGFNADKVEMNSDATLSSVISSDLREYGLIPELIGRFPVVTHTNQLTADDLVRIIQEPKNSLLKQYRKLLSMDGVTITFTEEAYREIANIALSLEIGARGLRSIIETVLSDIMYDYAGGEQQTVEINKDYVLNSLVKYTKKTA